jgi:hypothetical protein
MSLENEIWFTKIIGKYNETVSIFQCKKTKIEIPFWIKEERIREYYETINPKWIDDENNYRLISQRSWGLGKRLRLYVNKTGEEFIIESTL